MTNQTDDNDAARAAREAAVMRMIDEHGVHDVLHAVVAACHKKVREAEDRRSHGAARDWRILCRMTTAAEETARRLDLL